MTITNDFFDRLSGGDQGATEAIWQNKIDGNWIDTAGWNFIGQPELNEPGLFDVDFRFDQMRETIRFKDLGGPARNIGIRGDAGFWQGIAYEVDIGTPTGEPIHHEMGHFLLRVKEPAGGAVKGETPEALRGDIIRQATIPRANAMMTTGELRPGTVEQSIAPNTNPFYSAIPVSRFPFIPAFRARFEYEGVRQEVEDAGGPDMSRPLEWLKDQDFGPAVAGSQDWVFEFRHDANPSKMASGHRVMNPVDIGHLLSDFWIGKRTHNGQGIDILQYAQKVDLTFGMVEFPHVAVNTLIRQPQS